jgi:hypothetical protein
MGTVWLIEIAAVAPTGQGLDAAVSGVSGDASFCFDTERETVDAP